MVKNQRAARQDKARAYGEAGRRQIDDGFGERDGRQ